MAAPRTLLCLSNRTTTHLPSSTSTPLSTFLRLALLPTTPNPSPRLPFLLPRTALRPTSSSFSTSPPRPTTSVLRNPRRDAAGVEMQVDITPRASKRLREIMAKDANPDLALRITVESGGCHGFQYLMALTTLPKDGEGEGADGEGDTVFVAEEARVVMDEASLELLRGSKVDYTMELIGSQFKIVDNPLATSSCGCGTSFDIKI